MANERWLADARQLLIDIERIYDDHYSRSYDQCVHDIFNAMRRIVRRNAAFGFVEVVHGRLGVSYIDEYYGEFANCMECGTDNILPCNYCRNCGADMR